MPKVMRWMYPKRIWAFSRSEPKIYLTFDDGPIPEVTPWVLDLLKEYNAKATFFCIGENVQKHPEIYNRIIAEGHSVGNHTFHHLNGWKTNTSTYIEDVSKAAEYIDSKLFRPPYGRITSNQAKQLKKKGYRIIMWDVLSYDFEASVSEEKCLHNVLNNIENGSIVVFHDSVKAEKNLRYVLPKVLNIFFSNCI
ncbi:polysaccharide deacetylase family protein [Jejudonia soesokkakensis]|uniref:Polysaccharide deacetylase family protein n=1 Tax=Jejudonia soesokkakensis TaxID=1323432 RepID=A0ABW2MUS4_9FLAO